MDRDIGLREDTRLVSSSLSGLFFVYRPKGRNETGMIKLVKVVFEYRPKGRYETGMVKLVRVVFVYRPK